METRGGITEPVLPGSFAANHPRRAAIFVRVGLSLVHIALGCLLGFLALELTLRLQPNLLLRGMALPAPVDAPLTQKTYAVRYSDADAFHWKPELIRPVDPENDQVEADVTYETDELGFRNSPPLPAVVDAVVLGRSISLAAHLAQPWTEMLAEKLDWEVLNLAQPGANMDTRLEYLKKYAEPRHPKWVIVEIAPSIDLTGIRAAEPTWYTQELLFPLIQTLVRKSGWSSTAASGTEPIYPLNLRLPGRDYGMTCCLHYLEFYTLNQATIKKSSNWAILQTQLAALQAEAEATGACMAILLAPTKPDLYLPVLEQPSQFEPAVKTIQPLTLDGDGYLHSLEDRPAVRADIFANAHSGRDLLAAYAARQNLPFIDPTDRMTQAIREGYDPVMVYDSHWNALGHQLVAEVAAQALRTASCP